MSNRLSKGVVHVGKISQDMPGFPKMGPAVTISAPASTAEFASGFVFGANDVVSGFIIKVLTAGASTGTLSLGLMNLAIGTSGFVALLPVGSTGIVANLSTVSSSAGAGAGWWVSANYTGTLLGGWHIGSTAGSTGDAEGGFFPRLYACDASTEKRLSYAVDGSTGLSTFKAVVYPIYYTLNV
ncbi:MAG: hypothetical protein RL409_2456 [Gemmatimonadota bacterium]|jgi:hypothetical protein